MASIVMTDRKTEFPIYRVRWRRETWHDWHVRYFARAVDALRRANHLALRDLYVEVTTATRTPWKGVSGWYEPDPREWTDGCDS